MKAFISPILGLLLAASTAHAQPTIAVVDGDTLRVDRRLVRLIGLDAPELHGACAARRLAELVQGGVTLHPHGRDRYGRTLALVFDADGRNLATVLISEGLARRYDGRGPRSGWC